jgi:2,5-diamino-6-(ribosylamino)-4(3H)-pyrimidinone 5'-phosphate reductase
VERPFVSINMAMTVDGKITSAAREYPTFTSPHDRRNMDRLRAEADVLVVGAGTVRADDPPLHVRDPALRAYRRSLGKGEGLDRVLVTASARLDPGSRFLDDAGGGARIVATVERAPGLEVQALERRAEVWRLGVERVDLGALLARLHERGARRVLVEGGAELNWALIREDLVDELYVTIAPALLGGRDAPTIVGGEGFAMAARRPLRLLDLRREGDELYCRFGWVR